MESKEYQLIENHLTSLKEFMNIRFNGIDQRLDKSNGKLDRHDQELIKLRELENVHIVNCPVNPRLRALEDDMLTRKSIKIYMRWLAAICVTIGGFIVGILELIFG